MFNCAVTQRCTIIAHDVLPSSFVELLLGLKRAWRMEDVSSEASEDSISSTQHTQTSLPIAAPLKTLLPPLKKTGGDSGSGSTPVLGTAAAGCDNGSDNTPPGEPGDDMMHQNVASPEQPVGDTMPQGRNLDTEATPPLAHAGSNSGGDTNGDMDLAGSDGGD